MSTEVKHRRGTAAQHATFTGAEAEITYDSTNKTLRAHDGVKAGGFPLAREPYATVAAMRADTTAWPVGARLSVKGGSEYDVVASDPDLTTAGAAPVVIRPNSSGEISAASLVSASDGGDICPSISRALGRAEKIGGARVILPPGLYTSASTVQVGGLARAHVEARGANITIEEAVGVFRSGAPVWEDVQSIEPVNGALFFELRNVISVSDGTQFSRGDVIKLVSDDKQRCTRAAPGDGTDYRTGWMAVVMSVSGNLVTIDAPCPFDLTTNPRIARMPRRRHVWDGGVVGYAAGLTLPGGETNWPTAFVHRGVSDLLINVTIENTPAAAISANGCFKPIVDVVGRNLDNIESAIQLGYLFNAQGCYFDRSNVNAGRNRHAYTTNQSLVAANSLAIEEYGGTFGSLVTGQSHGQSQAGFDTHHGAENVTFDGVVASGGTQGGGQIVLRGLGHRVLNPRLSNGRHGILCYTETDVPGDVLSSATVINADVDVDFSPVRTYDPGFAPRGARLTLVGGRYRSRHFGEAFAIAGTLTMEGAVRIRPSGLSSVNTNNKATIAVVDGVVDARQADILIDMQDIPSGATGYDAIESGGAALDSWTGGKIRTINDAGMTRMFSKKSGTTATVQFAPEEMISQKQGGFTVSRTTAGLTGSADVGFTGPWRWSCEGQPERSGYIQADIADGYIVPLLGRGDLEVVARLRATPDAATLGALPNGAFLGQRLTIIAPPFGGAAITILHGTGGNTSLPGATNITLTTTGITLTWNGGAWERA